MAAGLTPRIAELSRYDVAAIPSREVHQLTGVPVESIEDHLADLGRLGVQRTSTGSRRGWHHSKDGGVVGDASTWALASLHAPAVEPLSLREIVALLGLLPLEETKKSKEPPLYGGYVQRRTDALLSPGLGLYRGARGDHCWRLVTLLVAHAGSGRAVLTPTRLADLFRLLGIDLSVATLSRALSHLADHQVLAKVGRAYHWQVDAVVQRLEDLGFTQGTPDDYALEPLDRTRPSERQGRGRQRANFSASRNQMHDAHGGRLSHRASDLYLHRDRHVAEALAEGATQWAADLERMETFQHVVDFLMGRGLPEAPPPVPVAPAAPLKPLERSPELQARMLAIRDRILSGAA
jgi:hypothetical protein